MDKPTEPIRDGFTFVDWYTDEATTQAYDFATPITANLMLYAKWAADSSSDIVFAALSDADKTVIGMREFLLTVTYNNLTQKDSLVFIVGESAEAPAWSVVENHPAKITRTFDNAEKQTREIYFSVTEKFPGYNESTPHTAVDLSNDNGNEVAYMKEQAPGIMVPGQSYYVHIYRDGQHLKTSPAVTLLNYPKASDLPAQVSAANNVWADGPFAHPSMANYSFRMNMWLKPGSDTSFRDLEMRADEFGLLPVRMIVPIDPDNPTSTVPPGTCPTGTPLGGSIAFAVTLPTQSITTLVFFPTREVIPPTRSNNGLYRTINNPISFDQDEMVDGFFSVVPTSGDLFLAGPVNYTVFVIDCISGGLNSISWKVSLTE